MTEKTVPAEWLQARTSIVEAEEKNTRASDARSDKFPDLLLPFGRQYAQWQRLKDSMQPGDELWTFVSSQESWKELRGRAGIALVREGKAIDFIITLMN